MEDWKSILNEILTFEKKTTKSGGFSSFDKKSNKKKKKTPKVEDFQVLKKNPIKKKKVFQVFVIKSGGFWRKKTPKVEDWKSILIEILTFEKKTTKSGGFSSFEEKSILRNHQKWRFFRF